MPGQGQRLSATQNLAQKQVMTQKLIQSIKLMAMPLTELREAIVQEVEKNPALEVVRDGVDSSDEMAREARDDGFRDAEPFAESSDPGYQPAPHGDPDSKQRFLEGALSRDESLHDHLINQLRFLDVSPQTSALAELIIWNLDESGFHREEPSLLIEPGNDFLLQEALETVHTLEPQGCGCRDWTESVLVQARIRGDAPDFFDRFVLEALPELERRKDEDVRASMKISREDWEDLIQYLPILNPFPGRLFSTPSTSYIAPDLEVRRVEGEYVLVLNDEAVPVLRVDPEFERIKNDDSADKDAKRFISEHSREARYFINSLAQRDNTLLKAAGAVIDFQRDFFSGGPRFLKPLTLKDVAAEIGVHEATVSRITTNKYVQTEWGLFELKFFFTNSISGTGSSGSSVSRVAAKEVIKEILSEAEPEKKISDQKLSDLLARRGINLARRTVAKYRKELDLPSSYHR